MNTNTLAAGIIGFLLGGLVVSTAAELGEDSTTSQSMHASEKADATGFNDADVEFAQAMVPHHRQATEMASLADQRTRNQEVLELAAAIKKAQGPEIDVMAGWLDTWGKDMPGGHSMEDTNSAEPGMMSAPEMAELAAKSDTSFDRQFLNMMIDHHRGAISMAKTEQDQGKYPAALALAKKIQADQAKEIARMKALLR